MIRFLHLIVENFKVLAEADIQLSGRGLVLLTGDNGDTDAAVSNGSGKTTVFEAISWCLFGEFVGNARPGAEVIRRGAKSCEVTLVFADPYHTYTVTRAHHGKRTDLTIATDGVQTNERSAADNQKRIIELLGLDWDSFRNSVLYGQGDHNRFADAEVSDGDRKAILKRILRLERFDTALTKVREKIREVQESHRLATGASMVASGQVSALERQLGKARESAEEWKEDRANEIRDLMGQIDEAQKLQAPSENEIALLQLEQGRLQEAVTRAKTLQDEIYRVRLQLTSAKNQLAAAVAAKSSIAREGSKKSVELGLEGLATLEACPLCGETPSSLEALKENLLERHRQHDLERAQRLSIAENEIVGAQLAKGTVELELEALRAEEKEYAEVAEDLSAVNKRLNVLLERKAKHERVAERIGMLKKEIGKLRAEKNPHHATVEDTTNQLELAKDKYTRAEQKVARDAASLEPLRYWEEAFGNRGLPSFVLDSVVPMLSESANRYLEILADGDLKVAVSTTTELRSGASKEQLDFVFEIEGANGVTPSGGQRRKISLAIDLALMDLVATREGAQIDVLFLDEVFEGLDDEGRRRVVDLLHHLREHRGSIFVVSHDSRINDAFQTIVRVVKRGGNSVVVDGG